jgi:hypothetical protein
MSGCTLRIETARPRAPASLGNASRARNGPGWRGVDPFERLVCVQIPGDFFAVGQFYAKFPQVSEDEVIACAERAAAPRAAAPASAARSAGSAHPPARSEEVQPEVGAVRLAGYLPCRRAPGGSWSLPMAAAAAGTAPATGMSPAC